MSHLRLCALLGLGVVAAFLDALFALLNGDWRYARESLVEEWREGLWPAWIKVMMALGVVTDHHPLASVIRVRVHPADLRMARIWSGEDRLTVDAETRRLDEPIDRDQNMWNLWVAMLGWRGSLEPRIFSRPSLFWLYRWYLIGRQAQ